jgi:hypothetical protein
MSVSSNSTIHIEADWRKLSQKISGLEGYAGRNAMAAAIPAAFRVIDRFNARMVKSAQWRTKPRGKKAFRKRAASKGGYAYKVQPKKPRDWMAGSGYYNYKPKEMRHAHFVEHGFTARGGHDISGRHFRQLAFDRRYRKAQIRFLQAVRVAIAIASKHPKGRVTVKQIEAKIGKAWGKKA